MDKPVKNIYIKIRESLKDEFRHMAIPQTGAATIVTNSEGKVLLVQKSNGGKWVVPGGVQELGEDFRLLAARELEEETGIKYDPSKLILIDVVTGEKKHKIYPNGDECYNNTVLYWAKNADVQNIDLTGEDYQDDGSGEYELVKESLDYGFFDPHNLPENTCDIELIDAYLEYLNRQ